MKNEKNQTGENGDVVIIFYENQKPAVFSDPIGREIPPLFFIIFYK